MLNGNGGKESKKTSPKNSPDLAFVVQFRSPEKPGSVHFAGRVEHVMSGQNASFETPEEMIDFLRRVINQLKP